MTTSNPWPPERRAAQAARARANKPWLQSTGPSSAAGKAKVAGNAVKSGFYGQANQQELKEIRGFLRENRETVRECRKLFRDARATIRQSKAEAKNKLKGVAQNAAESENKLKTGVPA